MPPANIAKGLVSYLVNMYKLSGYKKKLNILIYFSEEEKFYFDNIGSNKKNDFKSYVRFPILLQK
jgi:hypothetical protein